MSLGRETIFAAIAGFALGLVAAWGVLSLPQLLQKKTSTTSNIEALKPGLNTEAPVQILSLNSPEDESISQTNQVNISGKAFSGSTIVIDGPLADKVLEAPSDGNFSATLDLEEGANEIQITAYAPNGSEKTEVRTVNYTKEDF